MTAPQPGDIFSPGDLLNNTYRIEAILGRGGTSEVYKARSEISGRVMAVKALRAEFASNEDFLVLMTREEDVREIQHEAVVRYFDTQRMPDGVVYLVMDYVDGPGLDRKLADGGMRASELMVVGQRVCEGLIAAHGRNIVHRDLSPDNIILRNDKADQAVIIDFGIAKDTNPGAQTIVGNEFAGKYAYAAPEQLSGNTDARSDIYSLGALLLSTFRGKKPDIGANPMEVVQKKAEPLDLEGVPDPLRRLIARMCEPNPELRFQSAEALLEAFKNPDSMSEDDPITAMLDDATVIAPVSARSTHLAPDVTTAIAKDAAPERRSLLPVLALVAVVVVGVGAYFGGAFDALIGPRYPVAAPYAMVIEKTPSGAAQAVGNVPSTEVEVALAERIEGLGGTAELTLASGDIPPTWGAGLLQIVETALPLEEFRIAVSDTQARVTGLAATRDEQATVQASFAAGFPEGFTGTAEIGLGPRFLLPGDVRPLLEDRADCGPLQLMSPPPVGYALEDRVIVTGRFAEEASRSALQAAISDIAGDRPVRVEGEVLNPSLCRIDGVLPKAGPGGFDIRLGYGDRAGDNLAGRYQVGENPTIDVRLPDDMTEGYLWVSVVDVQGIVFHLLPNRTRPDNSIAALRAEAEDGFVRVAYGLDEAQTSGKLAFTVDGSVLGKSKIIALHSDGPLFDELRPTTESVESYAEALITARDTSNVTVTSLDSAVLTTEE
ncbi:serine/threonine protein kinase [Pseudosulfitobacter koreensis]|uniref:Serine/threonine-protein kinase n=1 Tax=Pseudosulfitobacter koreensis TaxID=2968472 RepID=A0ABT1Z2K6_9RHOB|nr:serine/threonine protein kinase [Pseudosulfitobacter koreense]MCR8827370.1 serine/threonine-protein kinase [Pseudosulfitobacter koreense]